MGITLTKTHRLKRFTWLQWQVMHWQAASDELPALATEPPLASHGCPEGMVKIDGNYLMDTRGRDDSDAVLMAQNGTCTLWRTADRGPEGLCDRFDRDKWLTISAKFPRTRMTFCIDRYEFPNTYGEFPLIAVTFSESEAYCAKVGKRLCTETEWTFACEGEEGIPYPYGYNRDTSLCNIGVLAAGPPDDDTFKPRMTDHTARGIDAAWQGKRSGQQQTCKSPFGVMDMTGNVDEWTRTARKYGYKMIMKGGHWSYGRQRCRPQTRGHGPMYLRYDQGFRCCRDWQDQ